MNTIEIKINDQKFLADERLKDFLMYKKESIYIDVFGINEATDELFVQFKDGYSVIYALTPDLINQAIKAESIGKFVISLKKKYVARHIGSKTVVPASAEMVLLKHDIKGHKNNVYGRKHEQVQVLSREGTILTVQSIKGERFTVMTDDVLVKS